MIGFGISVEYLFLNILNNMVWIEIDIAPVILRATLIKERPKQTGYILLLCFNNDIAFQISNALFL